MPSWKKLLVSGSNATVPSVSTAADFTIDAGGDIILDADGTDILLKDGGTEFGSFKRASSDFIIKSATNDKDIVFKGVDNSATITALTLDMSEGGDAIFGGNVSGSSTSTGSFGHIRMNGKDLPKLNETGSSIHIGNGAGAADDGSASRGNIFIGFEAGNDNTSGHSNIAIGDKAYDEGVATNDYNVAIGRDALGGSHSGLGADRTVAIGSGAAFGAINNVTGMVAVGYESLTAVTTGKRNTALGYQSGNTITDGEDNVIIGWDADASGTGATNQIVIGRSVTGTGDNQTVIGNSSQTHVIFGGDALISGSAASTGSFGHSTIDSSLLVGRKTPRHANTLLGLEGTTGDNGEVYLDFDNTHASGLTRFRFLQNGTEKANITYDSGESDFFIRNRVNNNNADIIIGLKDGLTINTFKGDGTFIPAGDVSGSSTSTGSFGSVVVDNNLNVGTEIEGVGDTLEIKNAGFTFTGNGGQAQFGSATAGLFHSSGRVYVRKDAGFTDYAFKAVDHPGAAGFWVDTVGRMKFGAGYSNQAIIDMMTLGQQAGHASGSLLVSGSIIAKEGNISGSASSTGSFGRVDTVGDLHIGDDLYIAGGVIDLKNTGEQSVVRFYCESSNAHYAEIQAPEHTAFAGNVTLTLPSTTGTLALSSEIPSAAAISGSTVTQSFSDGTATLISGSSTSTGSLGKLILSETSKTALAIGHEGTDSDQNTVDIRSNDSSTSLRLVSNNDVNDYYDAIFRANYNDLNSVELEGPSGRVFLEYRHTGRKTLIGHTAGNTDVVSTILSGSAASTASFGKLLGDGSDLTGINTDLSSDTTPQLGGDLDLNSSDITGTGNIDIAGNITATGDVIAKNYIVSSSVTYMTQSFSSGSTIFGDTLNDTHRFTGSLLLTGSNLTIDSVGGVSGSSTSTGSFGSGFFDGRVGIYQKTPTAELHISSPSSQPGIRVDGAYANIQIEGDNLAHISLKDEGATSGERVYQISSDGGILNFNRTNDAISSVTATPLKLKDDKVEVLNISGSATSTGSFGVIRSMSTLGYSLFYNQVYVNKDGSASTPSINVIPQGGNGFYKYASNEIGVTTNGAATARFSSTAGLEMLVGNVSGSSTSTGSFGKLAVGTATIQIPSNGFITMGSEDGMVMNTRFGNNAGQNLQAGGTQNVIIGEDAGAALTTGDTNVAVGSEALKTATGDSNNVAIGRRALHDLNTTNARNVAVGTAAGDGMTTGTQNVLLGHSTNTSAVNGTNQIAIGSGVTGTGDNQTVIGNSSQTHVVFGGDALISGSAASTASFGRLETFGASTFSGSLVVSGTLKLPNISDLSASLAAAVAGGDNLGNHTATQNLVMGGNDITGLGALTATGNISSSLASTGSFGLLMVGGGNFTSASLAAGGDSFSNGTATLISGSSTSTGSFGHLNVDGPYFAISDEKSAVISGNSSILVVGSGSMPVYQGNVIGVKHATHSRFKLQTDVSGSGVGNGFEMSLGSTAALINRHNIDHVIFGTGNVETMRHHYSPYGNIVGINSGPNPENYGGAGITLGGLNTFTRVKICSSTTGIGSANGLEFIMSTGDATIYNRESANMKIGTGNSADQFKIINGTDSQLLLLSGSKVSGSSASLGSFGSVFTATHVTASKNIVSTGANALISGSSTSTGSFGFVKTAGAGNVALFGDSALADEYIAVRSTSNGAMFGIDASLNSGNGGVLISGGTNKSFAIKVADSSGFGAGTPEFTIDTSGNVDITSGYLKVAAGATGEYFRVGGDDNNNERALRFSSSTTSFTGDTHTINAPSAGGNIVFQTTSTERLRINNAGSLYLSGSVTASGNLEVAGNISGSATSTGSFGSVHIPDNIGVNTTAPKSQLHLYRDDSITHGPGQATGTGGLLIEQDGTGDAVMEFLTTGAQNYIIGIDNDDGDKLKITPGQFRLGDGTVMFTYGHTGIMTLQGTTARLAIGSGTANMQLDVTGFGQVTEKFRIGKGGSSTPDNTLEVHGDAIITGSLTVEGDITAQRYIVSSSVTHMTTSFSSGSTIFGDSLDDTHRFTGSLFIQSGSISQELHAVTNNDRMFFGRYTGGIPVSGSSNISRFATGSEGETIDLGYTTVDGDGNTVLTTTGDGIHVNSSSYWYNNAFFKLGSEPNHITYGGAEIKVKGNFLPTADNSSDLGSASFRWANVYSADLHLSNEDTKGNEVDGTTGNWTIQEGEDDLYLLNRKNGKKYKFKLEEID